MHAAPSADPARVHPPGQPPPVFTIGHSTHSFGAFADLLAQEDVQCVVDVRKLTGSRRFPQFNADALAPALAARGVGYVHIAALGGRRGRSLPVGEPSPNGYWTHDSFRRYADYAMGPTFAEGLDALRAQAQSQRCALMCAEALWWRCHRRIIADYLLLEGREVRHILGPPPAQPAQMTPGARSVPAQAPGGRAVLVYPAAPTPAPFA